MAASVSKTLISAVMGGASAFIFAPILWPAVVFSGAGNIWGFDPLLFSGLLAVAMFALIGGLLTGLLFGFPLLLTLQRFRMESRFLVVLAGAMASVAIFSGFFSWPVSAWPLYLFLSVIGGLCSTVALWTLRSNFHRTRPPSAAGELKR